MTTVGEHNKQNIATDLWTADNERQVLIAVAACPLFGCLSLQMTVASAVSLTDVTIRCMCPYDRQMTDGDELGR